MDEVLIDTDVILDFFFDRKPHSNFAAEVLLLCESRKIQGYITPVVICNAYYLLRKTAGHDYVVEKLKDLMMILDSLTMNRRIIIDALNSEFNDFEDALQNFAAIEGGMVGIIITRNIKDFKKSKLNVLTPESYLKQRASK